MSRDKQIEEIKAKILEDCGGDCENCEFHNMKVCYDNYIANRLYNAGYRKASDLAEEIFAEIERIIDKHYNKHIFGSNDLEDEEKDAVINFSDDVTYDIAELKKKYIGKDTNVTTKESEKDNG